MAAAKALSAQHKQQLQAMGFDFSKLDWTKIVAIIQMLVSLFGSSEAQPQALKAATGCDDACSEHAHAAVCHALAAAHEALQCCGTPQPPAP